MAREVPHTASGNQWIPSNHALKKLPAISLGIRLFPVSSNWLPFSLPRRRDWVRPGRALARESVACVCACALPPPRCMHIADEVCCLGRAAERSRRPPGAGSYFRGAVMRTVIHRVHAASVCVRDPFCSQLWNRLLRQKQPEALFERDTMPRVPKREKFRRA